MLSLENSLSELMYESMVYKQNSVIVNLDSSILVNYEDHSYESH